MHLQDGVNVCRSTRTIRSPFEEPVGRTQRRSRRPLDGVLVFLE